jgi:regulator of sigma E protease
MQNIFSHPIIAMLIMLGSLILFHELGHYLVGRWCGVAIEKFAIGFGHRIAAFRRGQTDYLIGWIPLGGYVKFYGSYRNEDVPDSVTGTLFWQAPVWKRALIVVAGPVANFLLAFVILWAMVMHGIEHPPAQVGDVIEGGRAQQAGILPGDRFLEVDGRKVKGWSDIERLFQKSPDRPLKIVVDREGTVLEKEVTPEAVTGRSIFGSTSKIGRVGVALGYPSAVVTMLSPDSVLSKDGLVTGDRVEAWFDDQGVEHRIHGLHETFHLFSQWSRSGVKSVKVSVRPISIVEDEAGKLKEKVTADARLVQLNVSRWPSIGSESDRAYAQTLGAVDSHLTVGFPRGVTKEVLRPGDRIVAWDGSKIKNIFGLQEVMENWRKPDVTLDLIRDFKPLTVNVGLKPIELQLPEGAVTAYVLDVGMLGQTALPDPVINREANPYKAALVAIDEGYTQTSMMVTSLWMIISGSMPVKALGGPVMIAKVAGDSAKAGWMAFFASMAVISINLGLVNLFPIPVLDGGQLLLLAAEGVKRAPIEESTIENFQKIGFVIVMSLVILALYNDLSRFWSSMVRSILN